MNFGIMGHLKVAAEITDSLTGTKRHLKMICLRVVMLTCSASAMF